MLVAGRPGDGESGDTLAGEPTLFLDLVMPAGCC